MLTRSCTRIGLVALCVCGVVTASDSPSADPTITLSRGEPFAANDVAVLFNMFMYEHGKTYKDMDEHAERYEIFTQNLEKIRDHNARVPRESYTAAINHLADVAWVEFKQKVLMPGQDCSATASSTPHHKRPWHKSHDHPLDKYSASDRPLPPWFDWRDYGIIGPVKNQGHCGSCWAFSTVASVEAHTALQRLRAGDLKGFHGPPSLSEQQLVDCAGAFQNNGCDGGLPSRAFEYLRYNNGLETEEEYPYIDGGNETHPVHQCHLHHQKDGSDLATVPFGAFNLTSRDELELQEVVATTGPVTIAFDATDDFRFYSGGVYANSTCKKDVSDVNHAVVIVGYGTDEESGLPYWWVRNSWGAKWGLDGYFKILRGANECGLADCASFPNMYAPGLIEDGQSSANTGFLATYAKDAMPRVKWDINKSRRIQLSQRMEGNSGDDLRHEARGSTVMKQRDEDGFKEFVW